MATSKGLSKGKSGKGKGSMDSNATLKQSRLRGLGCPGIGRRTVLPILCRMRSLPVGSVSSCWMLFLGQPFAIALQPSVQQLILFPVPPPASMVGQLAEHTQGTGSRLWTRSAGWSCTIATRPAEPIEGQGAEPVRPSWRGKFDADPWQ